MTFRVVICPRCFWAFPYGTVRCKGCHHTFKLAVSLKKKKATADMSTLMKRQNDLVNRMVYFKSAVRPQVGLTTRVVGVTVRLGLPGVQYRRLGRPAAWRWYE